MYDNIGTQHDPSNADLALIVERMGTGMLVVGNDGRVFFMNLAAASILGLAQNDVKGNLYELVPQISVLLEGESPRYQGQERITLPDGTAKTIGFLTELKGDHRLIFVWDAGQAKQEKERKNRAEHLAVMDKLSSRLSHEIRNPLASVLAGLQTLETGTSLSSDDLFVLRLVLEEVRSVIRIVKRLLDSIRTDISRPFGVEVSQLLEGAVDTLIRDAREKDINVTIIPAEKDNRVLVDRKAMERAIENLLRNAVEATNSGGAISVGWRELGEYEKRSTFPGFDGSVVGIYGEDDGGGLPKDLTQSAILKPFVTTKRSNIGLGLSVTQEIVDLHGGVLFLGRSPRGGTTFEILIPAIDSVSHVEPPTADSRELVSTERECHACTTRSIEVTDLCWVAQGRSHRKQTGTWPETCVKCPVFKSHNLHSYFDPNYMSGKDQ